MDSHPTSGQADRAIRRTAFCTEHGFTADAAAELCPLCGQKTQRQFPLITAEDWSRFAAAEFSPASQSKPLQFGLKAMMIGVSLLSVCLGVMRWSPGLAMLLAVGIAPPLLTWKYQWGYDGMIDLSRVGRVVLCLTAILTIGAPLLMFGSMIGLMISLAFVRQFDGPTVLLTALGFFWAVAVR